MQDCGCQDYRLTRRTLLKLGATGLGVAALGPFGRGALLPTPAHAAALPNHKRMLVLNMRGGNDGLNTIIPVTEARYYDRRPNLAIASNDALSLASGPGAVTDYKLHPALTTLQSLWNDGDVAMVLGVGYPEANLSHFTSEDIWSFGVREFQRLGVRSGWVARFTDRHVTTPMGVVSVGLGTRSDFLGGDRQPFIASRLDRFRFEQPSQHRNNHVHRIATVRRMLELTPDGKGRRGQIRDAAKQAHTLVGQIESALGSYSTAVTYPNTGLARRLRDVAVIIQAGFETKLFYTGMGGFDTHGDQGPRHETLLGELDGGLAAFVEDAKAMGIWQDTAIVVITEFGRRNFENGSGGTDHGHGNCSFVIGGAVKGGIYGPDITEAALDERYMPFEVDFRAIYKQVLDKHLGVDPDALFPEQLMSNVSIGDLF